MNILVIAQNLDYTAPGSVFKNIINGLSNFNTVDLLYDGRLDKTQLNKIRKFYSCRTNKLFNYLGRKSILKKQINPYTDYWVRKSVKLIDGNKYDIVCSMLTSSYYFPILCGKIIADKCNSKYAVYSVDAIPAPGWGESNFSRFQTELVKSELQHCDYFATINQKMLNYQLTTFQNKPNLKTGVIYIPVDFESTFIDFPNNSHVFLYTGGIYGKRKIDKILRAFVRICRIYKDARLILVGTHLRKAFIKQIVGKYASSVKLLRYTKNLNKLYKESSIFINIDADIPNDVFLASKLMKYLPYNRQILCETGEGSPTHELLNGLKTVFICNHDEEEIFKGMLQAINNVDQADYSERKTLLHELSIEIQGKKLSEDLSTVIEK